MQEDKNYSRKKISNTFLEKGGITTLAIKERNRKAKKLEKVLDSNTTIIKKDGLTLIRLEKKFIDIDKNIKRMRFFVAKNLELELEDLKEVPRETIQKKRSQSEKIEKKESPKKPSFFLRLLKLPKRKPKSKPKTKLRKRVRRRITKPKTSVRKRLLNQRLKRLLTKLKVRTAARIKKLRGLKNYQNTIRAQRTQTRLERARVRQQIAIERAKIDAEARTKINAADAEARKRLNAAEKDSNRISKAADAEAKAKIAAANIQAQKRIDEANRVAIDAQEKVKTAKLEYEKLKIQSRTAASNVVDAQVALREASAEYKRVRENTTLAAAEREKLMARQVEIIKEMNAARQTVRDEVARLEARANETQKSIKDLEERAKTAADAQRQAAIKPSVEEIKPSVVASEASRAPAPAPVAPEAPKPIVAQTKPMPSEAQVRNSSKKVIAKNSNMLRKVVRAIPFVGVGIGVVLGTIRLYKNDYLGAGIEFANSLPAVGLLAAIPGELYLFVHDVYKDLFQIYPHLDSPVELVAQRVAYISKIVKEELEKYVDELKKREVVYTSELDAAAAFNPEIQEELSRRSAEEQKRRIEAGYEEKPTGVFPWIGQKLTQGANIVATPFKKPAPGSLVMPNQTVFDAIKKASELTGVDQSILLAMAKQESSFNPNAKANRTSAKGLFQFLDPTWKDMIRKYGKQYPQLLAGPYDALASSIAGALYIKESSEVLQKAGIEVNGTNIYALHFLGPGGGPKLLSADPNAIAANILPKAAKANKNIFYEKGDLRFPKTVKQVLEILYSKVGSQAEQYAAMINKNKIGSLISDKSMEVSTAEQRVTQQPAAVVVNNVNNTIIKGGGQQMPSSTPEVYQRVG